MQKVFFILFVMAVLIMPGCGVVTGIFKAGMWWAFFLVFVFIALVVWLVMKSRK